MRLFLSCRTLYLAMHYVYNRLIVAIGIDMVLVTTIYFDFLSKLQKTNFGSLTVL
jgi:hypothetical protein